jgi:hypothetical protein
VLEAAAVVRNRRRDKGMRTVMGKLRLSELGKDVDEFSQHADARATAS